MRELVTRGGFLSVLAVVGFEAAGWFSAGASPDARWLTTTVTVTQKCDPRLYVKVGLGRMGR